MKAGDKNTELGETDGTTNVALKEQAQASGDMFAQYEEDNAISLPPGYREMMAALPQITQQNQQLMQAVQGMLQNAQSTAKQGAELAASGIADKSSAMATRIANNLDRMAQKTGLSERPSRGF